MVPQEVADQMSAAQLYKATADASQRQHENEQNDQRVKVAVLEDQAAGGGVTTLLITDR